MPKQNGKSMYLAAFFLFAAGFGYLLYSGLSENSAYFLTVSEALAMDRAELSQVRLFGDVVEEGMVDKRQQMEISFQVEDKENPGNTVWVDYSGIVPDTFKPGVEVIVEGGFDPETGRFQAGTLMTKCPSKYEEMSEEQYG
jgi:cytochrome c-type biogenesis protein CcmE